jgi:cytoskeletal protein CcmA (bactofilin family)
MFRRGEEGRHVAGAASPAGAPGAAIDWDEDDPKDHRPIQPSEVSMRDQMTAGPEVTVVGKGARIEGNLISAGSLRIDGQVKGKVTAEGDVTLSPQSEVDAEIKATNVTVGGNFKGNIVAGNKAELARGGRVEGNVTSKVLVVAEGASFTGQSIMDGRQPGQAEPAKRAVEEPAEAPSAAASDSNSAAEVPESQRARR